MKDEMLFMITARSLIRFVAECDGGHQEALAARRVGQVEAETAEEIRQREEKMSTDRWLVKLTIGLVIVGAIQILVFGWQALSLRQTVNQMRESEERQLRAWVFVSQAAVKDPMQHDPIEAHVVIKNAGQTPAYDVRIFGGIIVANWPLDRKLPPIDFSKAASVGTLGPGMDGNQMCALQPQLNASGIQDLNDGKAAIYVFGEIQYRDVFNRTRRTKYRYFTEGAAGVRGISLCSHEQGNEAN